MLKGCFTCRHANPVLHLSTVPFTIDCAKLGRRVTEVEECEHWEETQKSAFTEVEVLTRRVEKLEKVLIVIEKKAYSPVPARSTRDRVLTEIEKLAKDALDEADKEEIR